MDWTCGVRRPENRLRLITSTLLYTARHSTSSAGMAWLHRSSGRSGRKEHVADIANFTAWAGPQGAQWSDMAVNIPCISSAVEPLYQTS